MHYRILFLFLVTVLFTGCDSSNPPEDDTTLSLEGSFSCYQQSNGGLSDGVNQCAANSVCHADTGCSRVESLIGGLATQQYALLPIDVSVGPQQACRGPFLPLGATYSRDDSSVVYTNDQGEETPYHDRYRSLAVEAADGSCSARVVADPCPEGTVVENSGPFPTLAICVPIVTCDELTPCPATADQCTENQCLGGECIEVSRVNLDCDDGDACTQNDICDAFNECIGEAIVCAGQLACANEVCQDGACVLTEEEPEGTLCEDGDPCTTRSECDAASTCATVNLLDCNDGEVCTDDSCDSAILEGSPCVNAALADATPCDDESLCSENDACVGGICSGDEVVCAEPGPCQVGSCDPLLGCVSELLANGLACPTGVCIDGACMDQVFVCNDVAPEFCDTINGSYGFYRCNISEGQSLGAVELVESCGALALCQIDTDPHCTAPQACADDTDCGPLETCVNSVCVQADSDGDGTIDALDNCPADPNVGQEDRDGDGVGDGCDNCPDDANADQLDTDDDGQGDACEIIIPDEICDNGLDDDGDTNIDCGDTDCFGIGNCPDETGNIVGGEQLCADEIDDDSDGFTDCADPDCVDAPNCAANPGAVFYEDIAPVLNVCVGCHHENANPSAGLNLSDAAAVRATIGTASSQGMDYITAGDSSLSYLWHKVDGTAGVINGGQMPQGGPPLSAEDITLIATWIDQGALFGPETDCSDTIDNDGDGDADCADADCSADPLCDPAGGNGGCVDNTACAVDEVCVANTCRPANGACTTFAVEVTVAVGTARIEWWPAVGDARREDVSTGIYDSQTECSAMVFGHDACTCHISDGVNYPCTFLNGDAGPVGCTWSGDNNN